MTTKKQGVRPSRAKSVGSKPAAQGHRPRVKAAVSRPRAAEHTEARKAPRVTRGDEVIELLQRKGGASIKEMVARFGLQAHSLRAVISVESRKRGLKVERVGKAHYRIVR